MDGTIVAETDRLMLRRWRHADRDPFAAINADARVMQHFPATLDRVASDAMVDRILQGFAENGFGLWAVERRGGPAFLGFAGLSVPNFQAQFTPCVEVGWRFAAEHWGQGYATEAARAVLILAFGSFALRGVVSFTSISNMRSRRVMERLGMVRSAADDFEHPALPAGHPLHRHVLYRLTRERWGSGA